MSDQEQIWDIIEDYSTAMFVSHGSLGLHARPMAPIIRPEEGRIWFLTNRDDAKTREIAANSSVTVTFSNGSNQHVAISGTATIVDERAFVRDLWSVASRVFYPGGPDDKDVVAIRVHPEIAELWDGHALPIAVFKMAAALVTRNPKIALGDHSKGELEAKPTDPD